MGVCCLKKYYLPPVLEANAKRGYLVPDQDTMIATLVTHASTLVKTRGFIFKKPVEKLNSILIIHYPIDIQCINDKCMAFDPVNGEVIYDHGVIGSLAFMLQHPSTTPYLDPYIDIEAPTMAYREEHYSEEYSIPPLKSGPGRYYVPLISYLLINSETRLLIEPPVFYMVGYPMTKRVFRVFESLRKYTLTIPYRREELVIELNRYVDRFQNPLTRKNIEEGLKKLYDKRVITTGDTLYIVSILK